MEEKKNATEGPQNGQNGPSAADYEVKEYMPGLMTTVIKVVEKTNVVFAKKGNLPIYPNSMFPWAAEVDKDWKKIRAELDVVMERKDELPNFHDIMDEVRTITSDNMWKTFFLAGYGLESEENSKRCPDTTEIIKRIPGMKTAFFSILAPKKHIPAHRGPYNGVLRYHLGLIVPEPKEICRIRIEDQIAHWEEGKSLIFDDTFEHEVWNDTDGFRAILFVDFVRPVMFPFNLLNEFLINAASFAPLIKEAEVRHKKWEKDFYKQ